MAPASGDSHDVIEFASMSDKLVQPHFNVVDYLNETLPPLHLSSQPSSNKQNRNSQLQHISTEIQTFLNRFSTHNIRASSELSSLTDDILRSGNRLAYEVEVLRGDANNLYDSLTENLQDEISSFVQKEQLQMSEHELKSENSLVANQHGNLDSEPDFIRQLRTLGLVKSRLEAVIMVFGEAMKWPIPPSDISVASSLISVSAPELGVANSADDDRAREQIRRYRTEISDLLDSEGGGYAGLEIGAKRVNEFRNLSLVWKTTSEEKARNKVVDGFSKLVDDRKKALDARNAVQKGNIVDASKPSSTPGRVGTPSIPTGGLFGGLRKLRDEIYLE